MLPLARFPALRSVDRDDAQRNIRLRHPGVHDFMVSGRKNRWSIEINAVDMGRCKLAVMQTGACSLTNARDGMLRMFLPFAEGLELGLGDRRIPVAAGRATFAPLSEHKCYYGDDFRGVVIGLPQAAVEEALADFGWSGDLAARVERLSENTGAGPDLAGRHLLALLRALDEAADEIAVHKRFLTAQEEILLLQIARVLADDEGGAPRQGALYLARAMDFMRSHLFEEIGPTAVARAAGCSLRNLQLLFQREFGQTITGNLRQLRLQAARERLLAGTEGDTVTTIAVDCGFSHLSDFARHYRNFFGELPSQTLARVSGISLT